MVTASSILRFAASVLATFRLLIGGRLTLPRSHVGARLEFADGKGGQVYRETVLTGEATSAPALLIVQFRLLLIGRNPALHRLFRIESMANTPLFAGFPGFRSKLWLCDSETAIYRGIYEWDGEDRATAYAETLVRLLRLVSVPGTLKYHVERDMRRDEFLGDPSSEIGLTDDASQAWWRPRLPTPTW